MKNKIVQGAFTIVTLYFLFSVAATVVRAPLLSLVYPENAILEIKRAQQNQRSLPDWWIVAAQKLHPGNSVLFRELGAYEVNRGNAGEALIFFQRAISLDPKNLANHIAYIESRDQTPNPLTFVDEVSLLSGAYLDNAAFRSMVRGLTEHPPRLEEVIGKKRFDVNRVRSDGVATMLARSFYLYGASVRDRDPAGAAYWWGLSAETDPGVSYYAVSKSNIESRALFDNAAAQETLMLCMNNKYARRHCEQALTRLKDGWVAPVGHYDKLIIPHLLLTQQ